MLRTERVIPLETERCPRSLFVLRMSALSLTAHSREGVLSKARHSWLFCFDVGWRYPETELQGMDMINFQVKKKKHAVLWKGSRGIMEMYRCDFQTPSSCNIHLCIKQMSCCTGKIEQKVTLWRVVDCFSFWPLVLLQRPPLRLWPAHPGSGELLKCPGANWRGLFPSLSKHSLGPC